MAQLVERLALGFSSGHGLMVCAFEPRIRLCADSVQPAWDSLPVPRAFSLSLKINIFLKIKKILILISETS